MKILDRGEHLGTLRRSHGVASYLTSSHRPLSSPAVSAPVAFAAEEPIAEELEHR